MPPTLVLWLCYGFIYWLFRQDMKLRQLSSYALLIPMIWLIMVSSRPVSFWFETSTGISTGQVNNLDGNPVDLVSLVLLFIAAIAMLSKRKFSWGRFVFSNKAIILLYLFVLLSSVWADYGFATLRRGVKDFGAVLSALILLTEAKPMDAIRTVFIRASFIVLPLSVVFIKYFPDIGRRPSRSGDSMFNGVAWHKQELGADLFLFGLFIVVDLLELRKNRNGEIDGAVRKRAIRIRYGLLLTGAWLLHTCGSVTSLICFSLGVFLLWATHRLLQYKSPLKMAVVSLLIVGFLAGVNGLFDVSSKVLHALGKNTTLTGRTEIWDLVKAANTPVLRGVGYQGFWTTAAATPIRLQFAGILNSAHNGILEMYLDCGLIGSGLLVLTLLVWCAKSLKRMLQGTLFGQVAFVMWVLSVIFNNSETAYFRMSPIWFTLLLMMLECPPPQEIFKFSRRLVNVTEVEPDPREQDFSEWSRLPESGVTQTR